MGNGKFVEHKNNKSFIQTSGTSRIDDKLLHDAVLNKSVDNITELLKHSRIKDYINTKTSHGDTALHLAVKEGRIEHCRLLCSNAYIDVNVVDNTPNHNTPLHYSANNIEILQILCAHKSAQVNAQNTRGETILHYAIVQGNCDVVNHLCHMRECDVNIVDGSGNTPLILALMAHNFNDDDKYLSIIELLLRRTDIDVNACTTTDAPIIIVCARRNCKGRMFIYI
jgi:ankyrin repeat protein